LSAVEVAALVARAAEFVDGINDRLIDISESPDQRAEVTGDEKVGEVKVVE